MGRRNEGRFWRRMERWEGGDLREERHEMWKEEEDNAMKEEEKRE